MRKDKHDLGSSVSQSRGCFSNFFNLYFIQQRLRLNDIVLKILDPGIKETMVPNDLGQFTDPMETYIVYLCKTNVH